MQAHKHQAQPWMLERRTFLKLSGLSLGSLFIGWPNPAKADSFENSVRSNASVTPRTSARNVILIVLRGGPSHVDTFDLKVGSWTPDKLGVEKLKAGYWWPSGIMPKLAQRTDKFTLVRSLQHQEVVHERAQYFLETGRRLNPGLRSEIPHVGAVVSLEFEAQRSSNDIFPSLMMFNSNVLTNNGFLSANQAPFKLANPIFGIENLQPSDGFPSFDRRRGVLQILDGLNSSPADDAGQALKIFQDRAEKMMKDPQTTSTFSASTTDVQRYGNNYFGTSLLVARNVLNTNRGTRFIEVDQYGWDHHSNIYSDKEDALPALCRQFDQGLSALLDDLSTLPGKASQGSLLNETLIVVAGDFGRTVKDLNSTNGRDHYPYLFSGLFAGGGVKGGRAIGETDESGAGLKDFGWNRSRPIHLPDVVTTIYSVLGIDWTKAITNTPSGRIYRYVDPQAIGDDESYEIDPLF